MPGDSGGHPHGADAALGLEDGFLETFQKGALHRQMLEYKRECERIAAKAETLERDSRENMHRLVATEECWSQLVDELRTTLGDAHSQGTMADEDTAMLNGHDDTEQSIADPALSKRLRETRALIAGLAKLPSSSAAGSDLSTRYQVLSAELIESRAAHKLLQAVLQRTQDELSATLESLKQLERKVVRDRSGTVQQLEKRTHGENKEDADRKPDTAAANANGAAAGQFGAGSPAPGTSPAKTAAVKQERGAAGVDEDMRDVLEGSSGLTRTEIEELRSAADARLKEATELRAEKLALLHEVDSLKIQRAEGGEAYFSHTPEHRQLSAQVRQLRDDAEAASALHSRVSAELDALRLEQGKLRATLAHEAAEHDAEANRKLGAALQDGARLRAERDARTAEVQELRTKESEKCRHVEQMRVLAEARQTRIDTLVSQTYRWRMRLAALEGDAALVEELAKAGVPPSTPSDSAAPAADLPDPSLPLPEEALLHATKARLEEAERLNRRYREELATLSNLSADDPELNIAEVLVQNEANALKHLEDARQELERLRKLLSDDGQPDGQKLLLRAETAEEEAKKLEAKVKTAEMSTTMLISEVTRLSETWEVLNRQNQNKVFDLAQYDARLELAARDRGRANQKYFASEREKETLVAQLTIADKMKGVQKTAIERQKEEAVALRARLADAELDLAKLRAEVAKGEQAVTEARREQTRVETRLEGAEKAAQEANRLLAEKTTLAETENTGKRRAEEQITKLEREAEKWRKKANTATAAANGQGRYVETDAKELSEENILLKRMLKCSSCQQRFKSHAITRCFHLFCKECIDARLETRQRKCPSCSIGFGQADVQQIYF